MYLMVKPNTLEIKFFNIDSKKFVQKASGNHSGQFKYVKNPTTGYSLCVSFQ